MTHVLSITDGSSTTTLTTSPWFLTGDGYVPAMPRRGADGEYEPVTETIELHVTGSGSTTTVQTLVNTVEKYLQRARQRQATGHGAKIYLQVQWDGEASTWRSEILEGEAEINVDTIRAWGQAFALFRLHITRRHFFEGPETLARLVQQYTGQGTSEQNISNTFNGEGQVGANFVEFSSTQIQGVLPTPAIIYQTNATAGQTRAYTSMQIALGKFIRPAGFNHWYQGQNATGSGSVITDSLSSGGQYRQVLAGTTTVYCGWDVFLLQDVSGRAYRLLARFRNYSPAPSIYVRPILRNQATGTRDLWYGDEVLLPHATTSNIVDLGMVPMPLAPSSARVMSLEMTLGFRATASAAIGLDFVQLTPTDGYRVLKPSSMSLTTGMMIVDNGVDELTYVDKTVNEFTNPFESDNYAPLDAGSGQYIMLYPGVAQRMYFLKTLTGGAIVSDVMKVKVYYRPRRLTL